MIQMDVKELCMALNGELIAGTAGKFCGVSIDSRKIESGQLFVAIIGENLDGHEYVVKALENGGAGAIVQRDMELPLTEEQFLVKVANTTEALQMLAHYYRKKFDLKVVGITGSVGKTTTKDMIASVLSEKYNVLKTEGNLNNYYGLPLTLFQLRPEHEVLVVEMGMSALKEIELLAKLAEPQIGVVTNVGWSHLEYLKTLDNVAVAKQELIENLTGQHLAILNVDDPRVKGMAQLTDQVAFFGQGEEADYRALEIHAREIEGTDVVVKAENQEMPLTIPLPGEHNVYNALAAMAVGRAWGLSFSEIQAGILKFRPSKMRMNIQKVGNGVTILNDAYNANPDSMRAGLKVLANGTGRKIAVLGDMLELGEFSESAHREIGQLAIEVGVDYLFAKGPFAPQVVEGAVEGGLDSERARAFATNEELAEQLLPMVQSGDTILVKGSRGMKMEEIVKRLEEM